MPSFGTRSTRLLKECDQAIQEVLNEAITHFDFSVICGSRDRHEQDRVFREGFSTVEWPNSRHNKTPSGAVDIVPYPGGFDNEDFAFFDMATYVLRAACSLGVDMEWGGHWISFPDLAHFQLKE